MSFTSLKRSRSAYSTTTAPGRSADASRTGRSTSSPTRLTRPVSVSSDAWGASGEPLRRRATAATTARSSVRRDTSASTTTSATPAASSSAARSSSSAATTTSGTAPSSSTIRPMAATVVGCAWTMTMAAETSSIRAPGQGTTRAWRSRGLRATASTVVDERRWSTRIRPSPTPRSSTTTRWAAARRPEASPGRPWTPWTTTSTVWTTERGRTRQSPTGPRRESSPPPGGWTTLESHPFPTRDERLRGRPGTNPDHDGNELP